MKNQLHRSLGKVQGTFGSFTAGQKAVALVGTGALLLAAFLVFRWAAAPSYAPLFSNLASSDAAAVISQLDAQGIPYELAAGGNTILVPRDQVYDTRIQLSAEGLPTGGDQGYSLLDNQSLSTSKFQEQTAFKRAMEGELATTIEAIDGVEGAIVKLAMPPEQVFSDSQDPTTASVLVRTQAGIALTPGQVQAIVNLVANSVAGLEADQVTVADASGRVLSATGTDGAGMTATQNQQVADVEAQKTAQVQALLDRVLGPGNAIAQVTANLDFDTAVTESTRYDDNGGLALSSRRQRESLQGAGTAGGASGVVGPDGQMDPTTTSDADSSYEKTDTIQDNALDKVVERREAAPGQIRSIHVMAALDTQALKGRDPADIERLISDGLGIDAARGDTIEVTDVAFERSAETAAAAELEAGEKAAARAEQMALYRNGGLIGLLVLAVLAAWIQARRRAKKRMEATSYVVEQLRRDAIERQSAQAALQAPAPALLALESAEASAGQEMRDEIAALVERQPEDVAALLRGWLVEGAR